MDIRKRPCEPLFFPASSYLCSLNGYGELNRRTFTSVRSSSVLKYSLARRFTFMRGEHARKIRLVASRNRFYKSWKYFMKEQHVSLLLQFFGRDFDRLFLFFLSQSTVRVYLTVSSNAAI